MGRIQERRSTGPHAPVSYTHLDVYKRQLQTLVIALGAGLGIWGAINLMAGYGNDNPGAKSQGMKRCV